MTTSNSGPLTTERRVPTLDREANEWVLRVHGAGPVRVKQNGLAHQILESAVRAYWNGMADKTGEIKRALEIAP